jgi:peptide/nickel transport system permease protein
VSKQAGTLQHVPPQRLALVVPMVFILLTFVFVLMRVIPGDPVSAALGGRLNPEALAQRRAAAGYDRPLLVQYLEYLGNVVRGDLGRTLGDNRAVTSIIVENGGATLTLAVAALAIALLTGIPLGLYSGRHRDTAGDVGIRLFGIVSYAAPVFFTGLILQLVFGVWLDLVPTSGQASPITQVRVDEITHILLLDALLAGNVEAALDVLHHLVLPAITLGLLLVGVFLRLVRVNLIQSLHGDYVEAARARGIPERFVVRRHAFRNALVPVVTVMGLQAALLLSGTILTEATFNWPGLGSELVDYLNNRDYVAVQGIITVFAVVVVVVSLLIDIVNALIDPRVRY